jgi:hypothetical protein
MGEMTMFAAIHRTKSNSTSSIEFYRILKWNSSLLSVVCKLTKLLLFGFIEYIIYKPTSARNSMVEMRHTGFLLLTVVVSWSNAFIWKVDEELMPLQTLTFSER